MGIPSSPGLLREEALKMAAWTLFNISRMLGSCLVCEISDVKLSDVGTRRGGYERKKLLSKILAMSFGFKTCKPKLSLTLRFWKTRAQLLGQINI